MFSAVRSHAAAPVRVTTTAANAADVTQASQLLHGEESFAYGDAGYTGVAKREENQNRAVRWEIAARPGTIRAMPEGKLKAGAQRVEYCKARIRAKVEHPFRVMKRQFGYVKVRFRRLTKNTAQILTRFALSNLWMARRRLLGTAGVLRLLDAY